MRRNVHIAHNTCYGLFLHCSIASFTTSSHAAVKDWEQLTSSLHQLVLSDKDMCKCTYRLLTDSSSNHLPDQSGAVYLVLLPLQQFARISQIKANKKKQIQSWMKPTVSHVFDAESPQRACSSSGRLTQRGSSLGHLPTPWQLWTGQWDGPVAWWWISSCWTFSLSSQACWPDPGWSRETPPPNSAASWSATWSCTAVFDLPADRSQLCSVSVPAVQMVV